MKNKLRQGWSAACAAGLALSSCHQAQPSDGGAQAIKDAGADAVTSGSDRAYRASPDKISEAAKGEAIRLDARKP